jgi:hypothetical protein
MFLRTFRRGRPPTGAFSFGIGVLCYNMTMMMPTRLQVRATTFDTYSSNSDHKPHHRRHHNLMRSSASLPLVGRHAIVGPHNMAPTSLAMACSPSRMHNTLTTCALISSIGVWLVNVCHTHNLALGPRRGVHQAWRFLPMLVIPAGSSTPWLWHRWCH